MFKRMAVVATEVALIMQSTLTTCATIVQPWGQHRRMLNVSYPLKIALVFYLTVEIWNSSVEKL